MYGKQQSMTVSISESRCFSFQVYKKTKWLRFIIIVSISESRCFSFQVMKRPSRTAIHHWNLFQSRNRDAFRFKTLRNLWRPAKTYRFQSRNRDAFRFKEAEACYCCGELYRFNLGIEMLFVSRRTAKVANRSYKLFQSRNRDAFRFK